MWRSAQGTSRARAWARLAHSTLLNDFSGVEVGIAYDWSQSAVLPSPSYYILTPKPSRPCAAITQTECLQQLTTRPPASEFLLTECIKALGRSAFTAHPLCHRRCKLASNFLLMCRLATRVLSHTGATSVCLGTLVLYLRQLPFPFK